MAYRPHRIRGERSTILFVSSTKYLSDKTPISRGQSWHPPRRTYCGPHRFPAVIVMTFLFPLSLLGWYVRIRNTLKAIFVFRERFIYSPYVCFLTIHDHLRPLMTWLTSHIFIYPILLRNVFFDILPGDKAVVLLTSIDGMEKKVRYQSKRGLIQVSGVRQLHTWTSLKHVNAWYHELVTYCLRALIMGWIVNRLINWTFGGKSGKEYPARASAYLCMFKREAELIFWRV